MGGDQDALVPLTSMLETFLEFGVQVGQPLNDANKKIGVWYERVGSRASAAA